MSATRHRGLRAELRSLFATAKMPSSPALAARILELINDPKSSVTDFGDVIRADPALSTRLLKTANSALFAQRTSVTTIERAVTILGLDRVKTVSLGFQLVAHLDRLGGAPFDMRRFWQHSLLRACLARSIAQQVVPEQQEEAFLVGLMQECGVLLLVQVLGSVYASLYRSNLSPTAFYAVERVSFPYDHVMAISALAAEWNLPRMIAVPAERHHSTVGLAEEPSEFERLSAVSYFVGGLRFVSDATVEPQEQSLREFWATSLGLDKGAWAHTQHQARYEYEQISTLYGDMLPEEIDIAELLSEANRQLASAANDADQRVLNVKAERDAIHQEQRHLQGALRAYRERAALDPLTNILNRGALAEAARKAVQQNLDQGTPIGVLFLDLDNFKRLNDTYGHQAGDRVLKALATMIAEEIGHTGSVGRYGGEEFVVILQDASAEETRQLGERIVRQVRTLDEGAHGVSGRVTCSVGAIWCDRLPANSAEELVACADELMYEAKRGGKDRCCFELLPGASASAEGHGCGKSSLSPPTDGPSDNEETDTRIARLLAIASRLNSTDEEALVGIRKQGRKKLVMPCVLHYFTGVDADVRAEDAAARNISTGGIGLLVGRPMVRGEAVEVALGKGTAQFFLAGLVAFCRRVDRAIHEVGVQFVTHAVTPIISQDASQALQNHDWVARALSAKKNGELEPQVPA